MRAPAEPGRVALPPLAPAEARALLAPPRLPVAAAARLPIVRRAAAIGVPMLLSAPAAGGRLRFARALHAIGGRAGPLFGTTGRRPSLAELPAGASVYVDVGRLAPEAALALEARLDDGDVWVIAAVEPGETPRGTLAARLTAVVLDVPPLRARTDDLVEIAAGVLRDFARRAGGEPWTLGSAAAASLAAHAWPGDVAELEAVLARAVLAAPGAVIEPEHLELAPPVPRAEANGTAHAGAQAEVEFLLAELAHELRNPMVTVKTYARHLPALLEDAEVRARFEQLTNDAIDRMDGLLENVLDFARLGVPHAESVAVGPLLARVVADVEPQLAGRAVHVRQATSPDARCAADPEHLAYALKNLFTGVVREVPAREQLALEATANGVVTLRFTAGAEAADRLRRLAAPGESTSLADPTLLPLSFRLARAVLERNGGSLTILRESNDATSVVIRLPAETPKDER